MIKAFIVISKKQHFIVFCLQWFSNILVEGRQQKTKNKNIEARSPALQADSLLSEPPGKLKNMEVGSLSLLQGVFPTQESNQGLLHCRQILYHLSHQGSPRILEWVACTFSRGSSQPRDQTQISHIVGGFFTN